MFITPKLYYLLTHDDKNICKNLNLYKLFLYYTLKISVILIKIYHI